MSDGKFLYVKPTQAFIESNQVAFWEPDDVLDPVHAEFDPKWSHPITSDNPQETKGFGGAFIAGDRLHPEKFYVVADTPKVREAIEKRKLVEIPAQVANKADSKVSK